MVARREPGPIPISDELMAALRECDRIELELDEEEDLPPEGSGELSVHALSRAEEALGASLPDELLALLALRHPIASILAGVGDLETVLVTEEHRVERVESGRGEDRDVREESGAPPLRELVAVAGVYSEPLQELVSGAHGGPERTLCIRRNRGRARPPTGASAELFVFEDGVLKERTTWGSFIRRTLGDELGAVASAVVYRDSERAFEARLVDDPQQPETPSRRVRHPKFGVGEVLQTIGAGPSSTLLVRFGEHGEKRVLARFVVDA